MKQTDTINTKRIKYICTFLNNGGGTLKAMLEWVNERLAYDNEETIQLRALQYCIENLRKGNFEHSRKDEKRPKGESMFAVDVKEKKYYRWGDKLDQKPVFGRLDEDERYTLPFLVGILERYRTIPAVEKILSELPGIFNVDNEALESHSAIIHAGPVLYKKTNENFPEQLIGCVIKILAHINRGEWIEFNYSKVNDDIKETKYQEVAPVQIRLYENYYYLIAADKDEKTVLHYRIDNINRLRVEPVITEEGIPKTFDRIKVERELRLEKRFENALGAWLHKDPDCLHEITLKFTHWAASYVRHLKFHHSQEDVTEKNDPGYVLRIRLRLLMKPKSSPNDPPQNRSVELAFLMGRFREYVEVVSDRPV